MDGMVVLVAICGMLAGTALGMFTGLVPGIHVNTMALLILVSHPSLSSLLEPMCGDLGLDIAVVPLILSCVIVSAAVTHSFLDFIPSVFIGVPDEEGCLSVLPGHRLLMAGKGLLAVRLAAGGSLCGAVVALLLSVPLLLFFQSGSRPLERLEGYIPGLLLIVLILLVLGQRQDRKVKALFLGRSFSLAAKISILPVRPMIGAEVILHGRARRHRLRYRIETAQGTFTAKYKGRLPRGHIALQGRWLLTRRRWVPSAMACGMVALSSLLGVSVLWGHLPDLLWSGVDGNMMFPLLTGLFGLPSLLSSQRGRPIPEQHDPGPAIIESHVVLSGSLSGLLAGLVPGVTSTSATVPASMVCGDVERDDEASAERFIVLSAAVGTAAMVFGVLALASTGHGGTGALMVVESMLGGSAIEAMARPTSAQLTLLLLSVLLSSLLAFVLTIKVGGIVARRSSGGSGARLSRAILALTVALCAVLCGPAGLLVLTVATLVGSLPPALGISRVCLTGCLILPIILSINGWRPGIEAFLGLMP